MGNIEPLLKMAINRKVTLFGNISLHDSLANMILQGYIEDNGSQRETGCTNLS